MSSLFLRTTKSLVRELGRKGELVPVDSLSRSPRLRPFCLVRKKHRRYLWPWDTPLIPTDFSLLDLLEPGCPEPEVNHSSPINVWEKVAGGLTGAVSLSTGLQGQVTGGSNSAYISALAVQTLWVSPCTWEMLLEKR
ncbi:Gasdermin-D [Cricetulus griseus]|nr:Gasdermin-D [Cricetulus griseus]